MNVPIALAGAIVGAVVSAAPAPEEPSAADPLASLEATRVALQAEVEALDSSLAATRAAAADEATALERRRLDLEGEAGALGMKERTLAHLLGERRAALQDRRGDARVFEAPTRTAVAALRTRIDDGPPVQLAERRARLEAIERAIEAEGAGRAAVLLLEALRIEREGARTVARAREPVELDDRRVVADVIRVGGIGAVYRTRGGRVGLAVRGASGWRWRPARADEARHVFALFEGWRGASPPDLIFVPTAGMRAFDGVTSVTQEEGSMMGDAR